MRFEENMLVRARKNKIRLINRAEQVFQRFLVQGVETAQNARVAWMSGGREGLREFVEEMRKQKMKALK